jgi:hypothetical protein
MNRIALKLFCLCLLLSTAAFSQHPGDYFKIRVVDDLTGRGVPLVELKTTNHMSYYTDNNGIIAFFEPGLMNQEIYFHIKSHGYEYPADGFGYRGKSLKTVPGDSAVLKIKRINIAERLYRITGEGLYGNSLLLGLPVPLKQPVLNGKIFGQDTFIETLYKGKIYWFWGDTDKPSYPLGNFATSGATSELPGKGGLNPGTGIDLAYFVDESGFSKKMCPVAGPGPVWIHFLTTIRDSTGIQRLLASYTRIKNLGEAYERGLALFDDSAEIFKPFVQFALKSPFFPEGHSYKTSVNGTEYLNFDFGTPYPLRVKSDWKHITDQSSYEAYTCLAEGSRYDTANIRLDRAPDGSLNYQWKTNTEPLNVEKERFLLKKGKLKPGETWLNLHDFLTGELIESHSGSVFWNSYRQKWVMLFEQVHGSTSHLGEIWYAEGDTPTGPWVYARKIVTHDKYTFYNVGQHPLFDQENGRLIYFEGTYTESFSGNPVPTPRYNYNQMMYRLDLNDPRLYLPSPVYRIKDKKSDFSYLMRQKIDSLKSWKQVQDIPFFALPPDRATEGSVPVYAIKEKGKVRLTTQTPGKPDNSAKLLFYGLPDTESTAVTPNGKWECLADDYSLNMKLWVTGSAISGTISNESLVIKKGAIRKDSVELFIDDTAEHKSYVVKALLTAGNLRGTYREINGEDKGIFTGKQAHTARQLMNSPMLVPLYEFVDAQGACSYSVKSEQEGLKRTERSVCLVWKNPSSILTLDFEARPVPIPK